MTSRIFTTHGIIRYDAKNGMQGRLLGVITFTDGKSLCVWDPDLHHKCLAMSKVRGGCIKVSYSFKHSQKWGDSLVTLEDARPEYEQYDDRRAADEAAEIGHSVPGKYVRDQISKRVQTAIERDKKGAA